MALRLGILKAANGNSGGGGASCLLGPRRWAHVQPIPAPLSGSIQPATTSSPPPLALPESDHDQNGAGFGFPSFFGFGGSMELMAVPKKKVSKHKRGIRNGPRALKPTPVIIRCRSCGRVKLPHFYCCSGERGNIGEQAEQK